MNSAGALTNAVSAGLLRQAEQGAATTAPLLKKALQADKDLVATLLPTTPLTAGGVDIRA